MNYQRPAQQPYGYSQSYSGYHNPNQRPNQYASPPVPVPPQQHHGGYAPASPATGSSTRPVWPPAPSPQRRYTTPVSQGFTSSTTPQSSGFQRVPSPQPPGFYPAQPPNRPVMPISQFQQRYPPNQTAPPQPPPQQYPMGPPSAPPSAMRRPLPTPTASSTSIPRGRPESMPPPPRPSIPHMLASESSVRPPMHNRANSVSPTKPSPAPVPRAPSPVKRALPSSPSAPLDVDIVRATLLARANTTTGVPSSSTPSSSSAPSTSSAISPTTRSLPYSPTKTPDLSRVSSLAQRFGGALLVSSLTPPSPTKPPEPPVSRINPPVKRFISPRSIAPMKSPEPLTNPPSSPKSKPAPTDLLSFDPPTSSSSGITHGTPRCLNDEDDEAEQEQPISPLLAGHTSPNAVERNNSRVLPSSPTKAPIPPSSLTERVKDDKPVWARRPPLTGARAAHIRMPASSSSSSSFTASSSGPSAPNPAPARSQSDFTRSSSPVKPPAATRSAFQRPVHAGPSSPMKPASSASPAPSSSRSLAFQLASQSIQGKPKLDAEDDSATGSEEEDQEYFPMSPLVLGPSRLANATPKTFHRPGSAASPPISTALPAKTQSSHRQMPSLEDSPPKRALPSAPGGTSRVAHSIPQINFSGPTSPPRTNGPASGTSSIPLINFSGHAGSTRTNGPAPSLPQISFSGPTSPPRASPAKTQPDPPRIQFNGSSSPTRSTGSASPVRAPIPKISFPASAGSESDSDSGGGPQIMVTSVDIVPAVRVSPPKASQPALPQISVTSAAPPIPTISEPGTSASQISVPATFSSSIADQQQLKLRGKGLVCGGCGRGIVGRIVSAMGLRWHPVCFKCTICAELLEHVSAYEHEGKPYCHLDYHEHFGPKCYHCKTPIVEERFITLDDPELGKRLYHEHHFFCAECGDPFLDPSSSSYNPYHKKAEYAQGPDDVGFTVYRGHPYCEACHVRLRIPKCKKCKKPLREGVAAIEALGGKYCWECFVCAGCETPFEDPSFYVREDLPFCERCFNIIVKNEI